MKVKRHEASVDITRRAKIEEVQTLPVCATQTRFRSHANYLHVWERGRVKTYLFEIFILFCYKYLECLAFHIPVLHVKKLAAIGLW